ncbi:glycosyl transferase family 51 [Catenulispora acidiphila DSM 44928]|uniref:Glycosyl transferase family 51 n=1 Tax=Catenulispora acidiphila (strain DSM 44928 / JCM 14897 / NBRC 102108 / NRRL B-24433 / ID139908) TaxID=479433 RepID=C7Q6L7_CATAD|nr:transglycosylase domain-containing protein [Catenulispora acidiphila]ACU74052.1 glycosyl transferase family 51 [Catenulispora acidiphila DSM 44928]
MALRVIDYPRRGKAGLRHWLPSWRLVASTLIAFVLLVTGGAWAVYASISIPPINETVTQQHLTVVDDKGVVLGRRGPEIRQDVPLAQVPVPVQNAFLSAEDRNFWSDGAISLTGTARALLNDLGGGSTQGGSTITQQYVKNAYLTDERTLSRKVKEAVIALKISEKQPKSEILQGYLNTVYFGRGASGVQMGARAWFSKDINQLSVAEGAVMAALVNAPSYYELAPKDPSIMAKLQARWNYVLDGLVTMGKLTPADRAAQQFPALAPWPRPSSETDNQDEYLIEEAIGEAEQKTGLSREQLETGGYTIYTTFDAKMQDAAAAAVKAQITSQLNASKRPVDADVHTAISTVVPGDGAVRVLYGGDDYSKEAFNASWQGTLSPGSSFKTFALAAYLQNGGTVSDTFDGTSPFHLPNSNTVIPNEGGTSYGDVSVQYALNQSINTVFVEMGQKIGMTKVADAARAAGIPVTAQQQSLPALPLGVVSTNPEQMAAAYGTFAAHGSQVDPYTVASVQQGGKTIYAHQSLAKQAFTPQVADQVTQALQNVVTNGSGGGAQLADGRDVAGKTGTTDLPGDGSKLGSVWFVGYTPTLSTAVAVWGQTDGGALTPINGMAGKDTVGGGAVAAPLWAAYMDKAVEGTTAQKFTFTAQNNQAAPMNPLSPSGSTTGTTGATPGKSSTGLPSPPSPTGTYQPPSPTTTTSSSGGKSTTTTSGGGSTSSKSQPPSSTRSRPTKPKPSSTSSTGQTGGPLPQSSGG